MQSTQLVFDEIFKSIAKTEKAVSAISQLSNDQLVGCKEYVTDIHQRLARVTAKVNCIYQAKEVKSSEEYFCSYKVYDIFEILVEALAAKKPTDIATFIEGNIRHLMHTIYADESSIGVISSAAPQKTFLYCDDKDLGVVEVTTGSMTVCSTPQRVGNVEQLPDLTILHFNDVYDICEHSAEPVGGIGRFAQALQDARETLLNPLTLFSGDLFFPSVLSQYTKGEHMLDALRVLGVHCSTMGNHDFDMGVEIFEKLVARSCIPWVVTNVIDSSTGKPPCGGIKSLLLKHNGMRVGIVGIVEKDWFATLSRVPPTIQFIEWKDCAADIAALRSRGADIVICLSHMRMYNDLKLPHVLPDIDLILGGHDHDPFFENVVVNIGGFVGAKVIPVIKSGSDFKMFAKLQLWRIGSQGQGVRVENQFVEVKKSLPVANRIEELMGTWSADRIPQELFTRLGYLDCELDVRTSELRTKETVVGNWVCDILREHTRSDVVLLNSGTLRADVVFPKDSIIRLLELRNILPMEDPCIVLEMTGAQLLECLENSVCKYPVHEGRFACTSGVEFTFDAQKPAGQRVLVDSVKIAKEPIDKAKVYKVATKEYIARGKDGYDCMKDCKRLLDPEDAETIPCIIVGYLRALSEGRRKMTNVLDRLKMNKKGGLVNRVVRKWQHMKKPEGEESEGGIPTFKHDVSLIAAADEGLPHIMASLEGRIKVLNGV